MRVPTPEQLLGYFHDLDIEIDPIREHGGLPVGYRLHGRSPLGDRRFASAEHLWRAWVGYAAFRIHERAKLRAFLRLWRAADQLGKQRLRGALDDYVRSDHQSELLSPIFEKLPANELSNMPKSWKHQIQTILASNDLRSFPTRARAAMS